MIFLFSLFSILVKLTTSSEKTLLNYKRVYYKESFDPYPPLKELDYLS